MTRRPDTLVPSLIAALALAAAPPLAALDPDLLAGMEARSIGPAAMSGRVVAIDAPPSDPDTIYVGASTGGLWKSVDGGLTWEPIFDEQPVASIGAVAVHPAHPDIVWVGTGEGNPRNSASVGNGVYRSRDGGHTWTHLGLEESERIPAIALHPSDPDVAWVAAQGPAWGEGSQRGVFKTEDGGGSWRRVLFVDEKTGAADLAMDPKNPGKLFAAMWHHRRWPWFFESGGPGSGIYVTHDGGESWKRLTPEDGLPEGDLGKIGIAVAPSDPSRVYAFAEAEGKDNLFIRSEDGGRRWKVVARSSEERIGNRPFYYAKIWVDPQDPGRIYSLWSLVSVSEDGGESWEVLIPYREVHVDHHAFWIDPGDPSHLLEGNDGGVYVSRDRGQTWRFVSNLPLAQFYHVRVDREVPYNVYGGLQDNGSWKGPNTVWENGGIRNHHWQELFFGDGFDVVPDPDDPMQGWAMAQEGYLARWNLRTGERKSVRPAPPEGEELRFNWNAGIAIDPFDSDTIYFGSQYVHRSADRGETWEVISPDLTTDNPDWQRQAESGGLTADVTGAENFTTIVAIAPSPVQKGVMWVGTDDGRLHVTRDGGGTWTSVEGNLRGVPANTWIPHVEPSRFEAGSAFVVFDNHRRNDWTPYAFKTADFGKTWKRLAAREVRGYALAIAQDPADPDLLFLGTEFGLWASLDGGGSWFRWTHGVPTVSVMDLAIQEREADLVVGTHGRGIFVLDDIAPLRTLSEPTLAEPLHLFAVPPAQQYRVAQTGSSRFPGHGEFRGKIQPYGALITYSLNAEGLPHPAEEKERARKEAERAERRARRAAAEEPGEVAVPAEEEKQGEEGPQVEIRVADPEGEVIRTFKADARLGINRAVWDLRRDPFRKPPKEEEVWAREEVGPDILPGTYTITVAYQDHEASAPVEVLADPRFDIPRGDREASYAAQLRAGELQDVAVEAIVRLLDTRKDVDAALAKAAPEGEKAQGEESPEEAAYEELERAAGELKDDLAKLERQLWKPPETKGIVADTDALSKIERAQRILASTWDAPTPTQEGYLREAEAALAAALSELNRFFAQEVTAFREKVREAGLELLPEHEPLAVPERGGAP